MASFFRLFLLSTVLYRLLGCPLRIASLRGWAPTAASRFQNQEANSRRIRRGGSFLPIEIGPFAKQKLEEARQPAADFHDAPPYEYSGEVVGSTGRMGSFWLIHHRKAITDKSNNLQTVAIAVPRGISPGCLTTNNSPIYVATPSAAWDRVYHATIPSRRHDLCLVGNGIPSDNFLDCTILVPHFAVLQVCRDSHGICATSHMSPPLQTSDHSPPSWIYGRHAKTLAEILEAHGVKVQIVDSFATIRLHAGLKLLWASCMWLLCHSNSITIDESPMTVGQVHENRQNELDRLVDELFPVLDDIIGSQIDGPSSTTKTISPSLVTRAYVDDYLRNYSKSIANAIPSKELALKEFRERNGVFLTRSKTNRNGPSFHRQLLEEYLTEDEIETMMFITETTPKLIAVDLPDVGIKAWGTPSAQIPSTIGTSQKKPKQVLIVGGGIMGSSIAFSLALRRPDWKITVVDESKEEEFGKTTKASWAWLNANNKQPKSYQLLNQFGIHAWKRHPHLHSLVSWLGSLVRFSELPPFVNSGGYPLEGPLGLKRLQELEPLSCWTSQIEESDDFAHGDTSLTFFFPDEGCVDPSSAVQCLRRHAQDLGVVFRFGQSVTNFIRDSEMGMVNSVEICDSSMQKTRIPADLVVAAAGCGMSKSFLGGVPLLERPGRVEYANPRHAEKTDEFEERRLRRILVDEKRCSHVLQRQNGNIVAGGGGRLQFGGSTRSNILSERDNLNPSPSDPNEPGALLRLACPMAPSPIGESEFISTYAAVRPMPQDGLPVIGFRDLGVYTVVTHSAITLGPLLASMAAAEITESVSLKLLEPYRPSRFGM